jgi:hypothetical protein
MDTKCHSFSLQERTKNEAAWMGGCLLPGCVEPNTCSALSIPDGVNIQLFSEPNFMGYTRSFQGPQEIPCLNNYGWNDRCVCVCARARACVCVCARLNNSAGTTGTDFHCQKSRI